MAEKAHKKCFWPEISTRKETKVACWFCGLGLLIVFLRSRLAAGTCLDMYAFRRAECLMQHSHRRDRLGMKIGLLLAIFAGFRAAFAFHGLLPSKKGEPDGEGTPCWVQRIMKGIPSQERIRIHVHSHLPRVFAVQQKPCRDQLPWTNCLYGRDEYLKSADGVDAFDGGRMRPRNPHVIG